MGPLIIAKPITVKSAPIITGNAKGGMILQPTDKLVRRILNWSSQGKKTTLKFAPEGIAFMPQGCLRANEVIPYSAFLSRNLFATTSIESITFKKDIPASGFTMRRMNAFLREGNYGAVKSLVADVRILPPIEQMISRGLPMIDLPVELRRIPGQYIHYTNYEGYLRIMMEQRIRVASYQDRRPKLCLTTESMNPDDFWKIYFIGNRTYSTESKGTYVVGFDFTDPNVCLEKPNENFEEYICRSTLKFGTDISVKFAGSNPVR
jgi:hypothetical protein